MALTLGQYHAWLLKHGFECIGGGVFSKVYAKPGSDRCIKVAKAEDAWPAYILWAMRKRYTGTFAPKVYSLKFHHGYYVAVMERLVCTLQDIICDSDDYYHHPGYTNQVRDFCRLGEHKHPDKADKWIKFAKAANGANLLQDLHNGNFMLRKDGQLVLIDPASRFSPTRPRIKAGYLRHQK